VVDIMSQIRVYGKLITDWDRSKIGYLQKSKSEVFTFNHFFLTGVLNYKIIPIKSIIKRAFYRKNLS